MANMMYHKILTAKSITKIELSLEHNRNNKTAIKIVQMRIETSKFKHKLML